MRHVHQGSNGPHVVAPNRKAAADRRYGPNPARASCSPPQLEELVERALSYLRAGYPINLAGPAGTGKTTLALHLAAQLRQPVTLIHGDDEFGSSDLVGNDHGYRKSKLIDNFIHSVVKTEETMKTLWTDNRLTTACRFGHVLIYDEFTRSRPEANNVLLERSRRTALEPAQASATAATATWKSTRPSAPSSPRIRRSTRACTRARTPCWTGSITIYMDHYDRDTEVAITASSGGVSTEMAEQIVDLVHFFRKRDPSGPASQHPGSHHDRQGPGLPGPHLRSGQSGRREHLPGRAARRQSLRPGQACRLRWSTCSRPCRRSGALPRIARPALDPAAASAPPVPRVGEEVLV